MSDVYDFTVIGGGIAGAAVAAHLAAEARVLLVEMESQPGYHSTGRSAALFIKSYGNDTVRALTRASKDFFFDPDPAFAASGLVRPRTILVTAAAGREEALDAFVEVVRTADTIERLSIDQARKLLPPLRPEAISGAVLSRNTADIEVHELHQGFLRQFRAWGGTVMTDSEVVALERTAGCWTVRTQNRAMRSVAIVNAAGAWAGHIGAMAGAFDIGLQPTKRTVCLFRAPEGAASDSWPMLVDAEDQFYLKPDAGLLLLSPADETPADPGDAQADELDIAIAVDRIERATTLEVRRIEHRWAGLRSFVPDRSPVIGPDPVAPDFHWFAALGGYGIQTAPALGRLGASLALGRGVPTVLADHGVVLDAVSIDRLVGSPVA